MRGTPLTHTGTGRKSGIIPAYAGNTSARVRRLSPCRDHPRVCGEHSSDRCRPPCMWGSSPRMRGTLMPTLKPLYAAGIIPAYAGNTKPAWRTPCGIWDHPRVCGEHAVIVDFVGGLSGSSPRMRGTQSTIFRLRHNRGIIPAYAGNTLAKAVEMTARLDHPRVCGEH